MAHSIVRDGATPIVVMFTELELGLIDHHPILITETEVIKSMIECLFHTEIPQESIVNYLHLGGTSAMIWSYLLV